MAVCYRHPNRETGVSCSSCGRPICPDCMTPTPVGMRCPESSRERTRVTRGVRSGPVVPRATQVLIAINVIAFLAETGAGGQIGGEGGGTIWDHGVLFGPLISQNHEYWRIVTGGFLHAGLFHLLVNMLSLWFVGSALEPAVGRVNFLFIYFVSLLAGSFGALWFQPQIPTVGASGAIFGIFGAFGAFFLLRRRALGSAGNAIIAQWLFWLALNLYLSFSDPNIGAWVHVGGLIAGFVLGILFTSTTLAQRRR